MALNPLGQCWLESLFALTLTAGDQHPNELSLAPIHWQVLARVEQLLSEVGGQIVAFLGSSCCIIGVSGGFYPAAILWVVGASLWLGWLRRNFSVFSVCVISRWGACSESHHAWRYGFLVFNHSIHVLFN